jgi:hypothetical protein
MIKAAFLFLASTTILLTSMVFAQNKPPSSLGAPGCGDPSIKFEVKTTREQHPAQPEAGKALVYFIEDDSDFESNPKPTTRMGVDGQWVGATHGNSYFFLRVDPGVHHLCASWQTAVILGQRHESAAVHFTAEAGGAYYFKIRNKWLREHGTSSVSLEPLDSDEGQLMANEFFFSTSQPKK